MPKVHINSAGNPGVCKAQNGGCPFGGEGEHYNSADEARAAYEKSQSSTPASLSKKVISKRDTEVREGVFNSDTTSDYVFVDSMTGAAVEGGSATVFDFDRVAVTQDEVNFYESENGFPGDYDAEDDFITYPKGFIAKNQLSSFGIEEFAEHEKVDRLRAVTPVIVDNQTGEIVHIDRTNNVYALRKSDVNPSMFNDRQKMKALAKEHGTTLWE